MRFSAFARGLIWFLGGWRGFVLCLFSLLGGVGFGAWFGESAGLDSALVSVSVLVSGEARGTAGLGREL